MRLLEDCPEIKQSTIFKGDAFIAKTMFFTYFSQLYFWVQRASYRALKCVSLWYGNAANKNSTWNQDSLNLLKNLIDIIEEI